MTGNQGSLKLAVWEVTVPATVVPKWKKRKILFEGSPNRIELPIQVKKSNLHGKLVAGMRSTIDHVDRRVSHVKERRAQDDRDSGDLATRGQQ